MATGRVAARCRRPLPRVVEGVIGETVDEMGPEEPAFFVVSSCRTTNQRGCALLSLCTIFFKLRCNLQQPGAVPRLELACLPAPTGETTMKILMTAAAAIACLVATQASAAQFAFTFDTTSTLFGGPFQTIRGIFTTSDVSVSRFGQTALAITSISGTINGVAISGLYDTGSPYFYFTTGPTFLDGSGVRFNAGSAMNIAFFHQDGVAADQYRVNGNGTISAFGPATSGPMALGAVPEPATWAMMILGMGAIGYSLRRRQKVARRVSYAA